MLMRYIFVVNIVFDILNININEAHFNNGKLILSVNMFNNITWNYMKGNYIRYHNFVWLICNTSINAVLYNN